MSRKHQDDQEFGSDSFLDVLANLVGILIILIVVVGVKVAKMPPSEWKMDAPAAASAPPSPPKELPPVPAFGPLPEIRPTEEMLRQAELLKRNYEQMQAQLQTLQTDEQRLASMRKDHEVELASLRQQMTAKVELLRDEKTQVSTLEMDVAHLRNQVTTLQQQAENTKPDEAPVEKLTHQLPPIGRVVTGDEVHFRLQNNRVSHVPVMDLAKEVQQDIHRRKDVLLNRSFYQGTTRPVDGYLMEYVLQRQGMSLNDEMRYGRGVIRIGVSGWVIKPVGPVMAEVSEEALQPGSGFLTALNRHGPTATVTFWVYPDSFDIHHKLKEYTHEAGFWVASRPLPTGVPIAGSPQGSRSVAQ
ncbi:hypothetical protein [Planctomicrobium piriforme]|nr:hypothetical protein [Planctomicrobium piriforme]